MGTTSWSIAFKSLLFSLCLGLFSNTLSAQSYQSGFDDYNAFSSDPLDLDYEASKYFGRFFQTSLLLGTGIFSGDLGKSNGAGFVIGAKFIYYFDRLWAAELGASWNRHNSFYNESNTGEANLDVQLATSIIPVIFGMRFAFDRENLPRSISMMNPYIAANAQLMFRTEAVDGSSNTAGLSGGVEDGLTTGATTNTTAFGVAFGGGLEFDVYRNQIMLGFDLRYHLNFWSDAETFVGNLGRAGNYFSFLATLSHNY